MTWARCTIIIITQVVRRSHIFMWKMLIDLLIRNLDSVPWAVTQASTRAASASLHHHSNSIRNSTTTSTNSILLQLQSIKGCQLWTLNSLTREARTKANSIWLQCQPPTKSLLTVQHSAHLVTDPFSKGIRSRKCLISMVCKRSLMLKTTPKCFVFVKRPSGSVRRWKRSTLTKCSNKSSCRQTLIRRNKRNWKCGWRRSVKRSRRPKRCLKKNYRRLPRWLKWLNRTLKISNESWTAVNPSSQA